MDNVQSSVLEQLDTLLNNSKEHKHGVEFLQKERDAHIQSRLDQLEASALDASGLLNGTGLVGPPKSEFMQEMIASLAELQTKVGDLQSIVDINTSNMAQTAKRQDLEQFKTSTWQTTEKGLQGIQSKLDCLAGRVDDLSDGVSCKQQDAQNGQQAIPKLALNLCPTSVGSTPPGSAVAVAMACTPQASLSVVPHDVRALSGEPSAARMTEQSKSGYLAPSARMASTPQRSLSSVPNEVHTSRSLPTRALSAVPFPRSPSPAPVCRSDKTLISNVPAPLGLERGNQLSASASVPTLSIVPQPFPDSQHSVRMLRPVTERLPMTQRSPPNQHRPLRSRSPGQSQVCVERPALSVRSNGAPAVSTTGSVTGSWQVPLHLAPTAVAFAPAVAATRKTSPSRVPHALQPHMQIQAPTPQKAMTFAPKPEMGLRWAGLMRPTVAPSRGGA